MGELSEPDEGTLHEICWDVLLNAENKPLGWIALEVAKRTAHACLGHTVKPLIQDDEKVVFRSRA